ncbi:MAG TPA: hypothetical protein VMZ26_16485, partial [Pyrinomonadaceae bacterium]|nr:hypothetical protein [Pyrinomonadaceae bacterium]
VVKPSVLAKPNFPLIEGKKRVKEGPCPPLRQFVFEVNGPIIALSLAANTRFFRASADKIKSPYHY